MALRSTLRDLVEMTRDEARLSTNTSRGTDQRGHIVQLIRRHYQMLAEGFEWEHLQLRRTMAESRKALAAGQAEYDFPVALNIQAGIKKVWVKWGAEWEPLTYGITVEDSSFLDMDNNATRADPIEKWDFYGHEQFQVWPRPQTDYTVDNGYAVAFDGQRRIEQLVDDESRADLDDILISLHAAAELLVENQQKDAAGLKLEMAGERHKRLTGALASKARVVMGIGVIDGNSRRRPARIDYVRR
jgi:hypothetical protein